MALLAILVVAALVRLYQINAPLLLLKQIAIANKARSIAGPPLALFRNTFDFLDHGGNRATLTEEAPLYTGVIGGCYRLFGEHEWLGRAASILATLIAIAALYDLIKREFDRHLALLSAFLFSLCPLLLFYGQAFQPDASMLAGMLLTACAYHRYLEGGRLRWLLAAALAGVLASLCKYYGLMVLIPLADMARRHKGWRACCQPAFLFLALTMIGVNLLWVATVFARTPNPTRTDVYFLFDMPEILWHATLYKRFFDRFLYKDCGPVTALLLAVGASSVASRRSRAGPMAAWTVMGVSFFFLFGPKLLCHDYYELMMLPGAAFWAAVGWKVLWGTAPQGVTRGRPWAWAGVSVLAAVAVLHSPWVLKSKFELERGFKILAERLNRLCSPAGKVIVLGPDKPADVVHYAHRQGWVLVGELPPAPRWRQAFVNYKALGAEYVAVYLNGSIGGAQRQSYLPLLTSLPLVEHRSGSWSVRGRQAEYYILNLRDAELTSRDQPAGGAPSDVGLWP